ncbi:MAG: transposase [Anaerolineae bacterium]
MARGIAKTETEASQQVFETLKRRGHPDMPPPLVSDGWGGIADALVEVYGVVPDYQGVGRPPTRKQAQTGWQYLQVVKQRENGRVVGTKLCVIFGQKQEVLALLGQSTAYIERTHLTMRLFNGRLTRKTLAFSKQVEMYRASAVWEDLVYHLARPLKTLWLEVHTANCRWLPRSPAMLAGLTDHIWTVKELLMTVVPLVNT